MSDGVDTKDLERWAKLIERNTKSFQKEQKPFLRKEGTKLRRKTAQQARVVHKVTGQYHRSIKRGKAWTKADIAQVRVYSSEPHAHLLEDGHDQVVNPPNPHGRGVKKGKGIGRKVGHVPGRWVFDKAYNAFVPIYAEDVEDFIDEVIDKI